MNSGGGAGGGGGSFSPFVITAGVKTLLVLLPSLALAIYIAVQVGSEEYALPIYLMIAIVAALSVGVMTRNVRFEAVVLGLLLIGYFVGSRGFADIALIRPLYVGELGLVAISLALVGRRILSSEAVDLTGLLPRLIILYFAYAVMRFSFDAKAYGFDAARDLAIVYYCIYFFFAYQISQRETEQAYLEKCFSIAFLGQALVAMTITIWPDLFDVSENFFATLFAQKGDLVATFSAVGIFYLYTHKQAYGIKWLRVLTICLLFATIGISIARSGIIALVITSCLMLVAGQRRYLLYPLCLAMLGAFVLMLATAIIDERDQNAQIVHFKEKFLSIVDYSGKYKYQSELGEMKFNNNEFRLAFWQSVIDETTADHPIVGKGFGYNFLGRFEQVYNRGSWEGLRSPHNYFVSVYGRMGLIGLLIFSAIAFYMFQQGVSAALRVRRGQLPLEVLGYWCGAWVLLISASVGVVLEGPMGGITFWTLLGLAYSYSKVDPVETKADKRKLDGGKPMPMLQHAG